MKKLWKITRKILLVLLIIVALLYALLQTSWMQTYLTQKIASYISDELGAEITVERVDIDFFARIVLDDLVLYEQGGDTLAHIKQLKARGFEQDKEKNLFLIGGVDLIEPDVRIVKHHKDSVLNIQFIIDFLEKGGSKDSTVAPQIFIEHLGIENGKLRIADENKNASPGYMNINDIQLSSLDMDVDEILIVDDSIHAEIMALNAIDIGGFELHNLAGTLAMNEGLLILENARIEAEQSVIEGRLAFKMKKFKDFDDFNNKVKMNLDLQNTTIHMADLGAFAPTLSGLDRTVEFTGKVKGKVTRLKGQDLFVKLDENTWFKGNVDFDGLPEIESTFIILEIDELVSNKSELDRVPLPPFDSGKTINTPDNFAELEQIKFQGEFIGFTNDFTAFGDLTTKIGGVTSAISLHEDGDNYSYTGNLETHAFDLGVFYGNDQLGKLTSDLEVNGRGLRLEEIDSEVDGTIQSVSINDYEYKDISVNGSYKHQFFDGELNVFDDNLFMDFTGKLDFTQKIPVFSFDADIHNVDLVQLNFLKHEEYSSLSTKIVANGSGIRLNDIKGSIVLTDLTYCSMSDECSLDSIKATASWHDGQRKIEISSSIVSGHLIGSYDIKYLNQSVSNILASVIPSLDPPKVTSKKPQSFRLEATIEDFDVVKRFFIEDLYIAQGARLQMHVDESLHGLEMTFVGDSIRYQGVLAEGITFDARRQDSAFYFTWLTDHTFLTDSLDFTDLAIEGRSENDTIYAAFAWENLSQRHSGDLNGQLTIRGNENFDFLFNNAIINVNDRDWIFDQNARIYVDGKHVKVEDFNMRHGSEYIKVHGLIADASRPKLTVDFNSFQFDNLNPFFSGTGIKLDGKITGQAAIQNVYAEPLFTSDLILEDLALNSHVMGDICLESFWDNSNSRLVVGGELEKGLYKTLEFGGFIVPKNERPLDININLDGFEIGFLNTFVQTGISDISGNLEGSIHLSGPFDMPELDGRINFSGVSATVDYLNTRYEILDEAIIASDMVALNGVRVKDEEGNVASLVGTILHENYKDWNFDMTLDLDVSERFLFLNTNEEMNTLYYGKAYGSGNVNIEGYADNLIFDINVKSQRGSKISMPFGGSQDVTFEDFVIFVNDNNNNTPEQLDLTGISLNFELDITEDIEFQLIFDEAVGDVMKGRGNGHISMDIDRLGSFNMYGVVELMEGNYLFTLKNLISKSFDVRQGGTISWYGDPLAADIQLETVYKLDASLHDLLGDDLSGQYKQRIPVELVMELDGKLLNPGIHFNIELPSSDEITRSRIESVLSSEQEKNRQAFSLLVLRRFVNPSNIGVTDSGGLIAENSSEFISSQVSNWLSQISDDFDIGVNYRPGDEITNEELAIALSTQLFNERLSISGNFGVSHGTQANQNPSSLIGDIKVEYKITKDGKIRLIAYNQSNDFDLVTTDQSTSKQGVGILFQQEFDSLDEFYCEIRKLFVRDDEFECP